MSKAYDGTRPMTPARRASIAIALLGGVVLASAAIVAIAQGGVFHEFVPNVGDEASSLVSSVGGIEPAAIVYDGELISAPEGGGLRDGERPMRALPGDGDEREEVGRRSPTFRPDRVTALPGAVGYFEIFSPAITPYKRVTALDGVALVSGVPVLAVANGDRERVTVEGAGAVAPDGRPRDRFWGTVVLDFGEGNVVPLPSVSPESRILTLRAEPPVPMHVERDRADNFFVVLDTPVSAHEVRLIFLTDAPRTYFGFETGVELPTAPSDALVSDVPILPDRVEADALEFARELGLSRGDPFDRVLETLAAHFRSFEESVEPPPDTGHIFLDLARGMRGVCRHRAYAFVITAMALGVSARFVQNEAHAWAEVHMPERRGWLRVDLGGSAQGLNERSAEHGPDYAPDVHDVLPRPPAYEQAARDARRTSEEPASPGTTTVADPSAPPGPSTEPAGLALDPAGAPVTAPPPGPPGVVRAPLALTLDQQQWAVLRGQSFEVTGRATSSGAAAGGVRVEVLLRDPRTSHEQLLGVTVTDDNGVFHASFGIRPDEPVGERRLVVRSPASARFEGASVD
jgi:hypothetical protein